jgi:predicted TIM-barrel fold metal-dependent hydrolase
MIHQAGSTRIDTKLELGRPALLDDIGREFRDLRIIIAHCGIPWVDEALFLLTKHPHFFADLSYLIATLTRRDLFLLLYRCEPAFVPLEKLFFGTDYPGFLYDPVKLREKLMTVNRRERYPPASSDPGLQARWNTGKQLRSTPPTVVLVGRIFGTMRHSRRSTGPRLCFL